MRKGGRGAAGRAKGSVKGKVLDDNDHDDDDGDEEEEEEEVIRCVCGASSQDENSGITWIACDDCGVWQHNVCMGISTFDEEIPDKYSCEQCNPAGHRDLLEATARGEKLWEERQRQHEAEKPERKRRRGGRKGGGRKRVSSGAGGATEAEAAPLVDKTEAKGVVGKRRMKDQDKEVVSRWSAALVLLLSYTC